MEEETPRMDTIGSPAKSEYEDHKPSHDQLSDVKEEKDSVPLQNVSNQNTKNSPLKQLKCPECDLVCHSYIINIFLTTCLDTGSKYKARVFDCNQEWTSIDKLQLASIGSKISIR